MFSCVKNYGLQRTYQTPPGGVNRDCIGGTTKKAEINGNKAFSTYFFVLGFDGMQQI